VRSGPLSARAFLVALVVVAPACHTRHTSVIAHVCTDLASGTEISEVRIRAGADAADAGGGELTFSFTPGREPQPFEAAIVAGGDQTGQLTVEAQGFLGDRRVVTETAILHFIPDQPQRLELFLARACRDLAVGCQPDETCDLGQCVRQTKAGVRGPLGPDKNVCSDGHQPADDGGRGGAGGTDGGPACRDGGGGGSPEQCFNGIDDDCDGKIDCEDPDCTDIAVCMPDPASDFKMGALLADANGACPDLFDRQVDLHQALDASPNCTGCTCSNPVTQCALSVYDYSTAADCQTNNGSSGLRGNPQSLTVTSDGTGQSTCMPALAGGSFGNTAFASQITKTTTCDAGGTPSVAPASWGQTKRFCPATHTGGGCSAGICVPRTTGSYCAYSTSQTACPAGYPKLPSSAFTFWYTGYTEGRACSTCTCSAEGGSCNGLILNRLDQCSGTSVNAVPLGQKDCGQEFSYRLQGSPAAPNQCFASSNATGAAMATGQGIVCCAP